MPGSKLPRLAAVTLLALLAVCGDGPTKPDPVERTWVSVTAGRAHTCGILSDGTGYCWGEDLYGQLGTLVASSGPAPIQGGRAWSVLTAGSFMTCGITNQKETYCWGRVSGLSGSTLAPHRVEGDPGFHTLRAGGSHVCGLTADGAGYCWGDNFRGQLGIGLVDGMGWGNRTAPTPVAGGHRFAVIAPGDEYTCALTTGSEVYCWGSGSTDGRLSTPESAGVELMPSSLASGGANTRRHGCGHVGETLYCWGFNASGQLGGGFVSDLHSGYQSPPVPVSMPAGVSLGLVSAGGGRTDPGYSGHTCALAAGGAAYCWGDNRVGQLGDGTAIDRGSPVAVHGNHRFVHLSAGDHHTCGVTAEGVLLCWGDGRGGQLGAGGAGRTRVPPVVVPVPR